MIGERLFCNKFGILNLPEGGYGRDLRGQWWCRPMGESGRRKLDARDVLEHSDGTVSVRARINGGAHCYLLERGIWTLTDGKEKIP